MRQPKIAEADIRLERLLLAIEVHGPSAVAEPPYPTLMKWMRANYQLGFRQVICALRENGMTRDDIVSHFGRSGKHSTDCACWDCVLRLHGSIVRAMAVRKAGEEENW